MFEDLIKAMRQLDGSRFSMPIPKDSEGYIDKECPSESCMFQFKIMEEDWANIVRDEEVFCPRCRHSAPADTWFTTEQVEAAKEQAFRHVQDTFDRAMSSSAAKFNRQQRRDAFISMNLSYKPSARPVLMPLASTEAMRLRATCVICHCRYSYIGAAFFCPSCGQNSAEETFKQTLTTIRTSLGLYDSLRSVLSRDDTENTIRLLREKGMQDIVTAIQRLAERLYQRIPNAPPARPNAFQRINDGSALWAAARNRPYSTILDAQELTRLRIYFQQRHLLAHREGIVDEEYLTKSGDTTYQVGQRLVISDRSVLDFVELADKLCAGLIASL